MRNSFRINKDPVQFIELLLYSFENMIRMNLCDKLDFVRPGKSKTSQFYHASPFISFNAV